MATYVIRRCLVGVLTVALVSLLVFLLTHALGDPAAAILGPLASDPGVLAAKRAELGLDRSLVAQYLGWWSDVVTGDAGTSYATGRPIGPDLADRMVNSLVLMAAGALLAVPLSVVVGVHAAVHRDGAFDAVTNVVTLVLVAIPEFLIATFLVIAFAVGWLDVLPATSSVRGGVRPWDDLDGMVLPAVTMALLAVPYVTRSMRASMSEVLEHDYVTTARLNGVPHHRLVWGHAWPNALGPSLQVIALSMTYMAGGAVVVEAVFNYPGVGTALVEAVRSHDVPVVQVVATFVAALYVVCNVGADVGTVLLTPRLRTSLP